MLRVNREMNRQWEHRVAVADELLQEAEVARSVERELDVLELGALAECAVVVVDDAVAQLHVVEVGAVMKGKGADTADALREDQLLEVCAGGEGAAGDFLDRDVIRGFCRHKKRPHRAVIARHGRKGTISFGFDFKCECHVRSKVLSFRNSDTSDGVPRGRLPSRRARLPDTR